MGGRARGEGGEGGSKEGDARGKGEPAGAGRVSTPAKVRVTSSRHNVHARKRRSASRHRLSLRMYSPVSVEVTGMTSLAKYGKLLQAPSYV